MYADWMKNINLEVTPAELEKYKEEKKKRISIDNFIDNKIK